MPKQIKKAVVIQHVPHEGLGIIEGELSKKGILNVEYVRVYQNDRVPRRLKEDSSLIVMGGPMGAYEDDIYPFIKDELYLIESALKSDAPVLGVCLGSQLMARAAGAKVYKGKTKEIGWYKLYLTEEGEKDRLLLGFPREMDVFQWHGDTFDVPENAVLLAKSKLFPNQLLRIGKRAYALQFHLEVTEKMIMEWLSVSEGELKELKGAVDPAAIKKETPLKISTLKRRGETFFSRFFRQ